MWFTEGSCRVDWGDCGTLAQASSKIIKSTVSMNYQIWCNKGLFLNYWLILHNHVFSNFKWLHNLLYSVLLGFWYFPLFLHLYLTSNKSVFYLFCISILLQFILFTACNILVIIALICPSPSPPLLSLQFHLHGELWLWPVPAECERFGRKSWD